MVISCSTHDSFCPSRESHWSRSHKPLSFPIVSQHERKKTFARRNLEADLRKMWNEHTKGNNSNIQRNTRNYLVFSKPDVRKLFEDESYLSPVLKTPKGWELLRSFLRAQWPVAFHDQDILDIPPGLGTVWRKDKIKHPLPLREFEGRRLLPSVLLRDRSDSNI